MAGPTSGNTGNLTVNGSQFLNLKSWNLVRANDVKAFVTNVTAPNTGTIAGSNSWNASFTGQLEDGSDVSFVEGELITLELINKGVGATPTNKWTGDMRVSELDISVDIDGGDTIDVSVSGTGNLINVFSSAA